MGKAPSSKTSFQLWLIKPSHYDDDGYVIQWWRSSLPSNSLATLYGIAGECAERKPLGEAVEIRIHALDETNTRIRPGHILREIRRAGTQALVCLVGVQSNQFPRSMDIARSFRAAGVPVAIGGFHVSGCISMLKETPADLREAMDLGVTLFAGELEGRLDGLLQDTAKGELKPLYNYLADLPSLPGQPPPYLPPDRLALTMGQRGSFDAGRGCPYLCSFCTIINVQGRKSRYRTADDVERLVRAHAADGIHNYFITDDNLARNVNWELIFDRLIELRESGMEFWLSIQVDTQSHRVPRFIEKAGKAGVTRAFIGMESINPDALKKARKGQNKITDYRTLLQAWHRAGVLIYAGYILGFPDDTAETIRRDLEIIKRELPVDLLYFFFLTPLPGSQDHQQMVDQGVELDPDMNDYDTSHVVVDHPRMTREEWKGIYREAWDTFYCDEHIATVLRRARVWGYNPRFMMQKLFAFYAPLVYEKIHPLEGGLIRRKYRSDRRPGLPVENPLLFYPKQIWEYAAKYAGGYAMHRRFKRILAQVEAEPNPGEYMDTAMTPVQEGEEQHLELLSTTSAQAFIQQRKVRETLRKKVHDKEAGSVK